MRRSGIVPRACCWALTVVFAATACGGASDVDPTAQSIVAPADGVVEILTQSDNGAGMQALGTFVLEYDAARNCLYSVEEDNNGEPGTGGRVAVVWPDGYTARSQGDSVTVFDSEGNAVARTGIPFTLSGGTGPVPADHCGAIGTWVASGSPAPLLDG